jgi:single-stranded DNA-binding protein
MTLHCLCAGPIFRAPVRRVSKAGKDFVTAILRVKGDETNSQFVRIVAFSEGVQTELMRLRDGDAISVQGPLKAEIYTGNDNISKLSLSIVADNILPLRQPPKERKTNEADAAESAFKKSEPAPATRHERQRRSGGTWRDEGDGPDDPFPF